MKLHAIPLTRVALLGAGAVYVPIIWPLAWAVAG